MGKQYAKSNKVAEGPGNLLSFNIRLGPTLCEENTHAAPPNRTLRPNLARFTSSICSPLEYKNATWNMCDHGFERKWEEETRRWGGVRKMSEVGKVMIIF